LISVSTTFHDSRDILAKLSLDIAQPFRAAAIFHGIVQQRRDCFCFVCAIFHRNRSDTEDMCDVRDPGLFPQLSAVNPCGVSQRLFELTRESHSYFSREPPLMEAGVAKIANAASFYDFAGEPTSSQAP
jgi:hypothetical protein